MTPAGVIEGGWEFVWAAYGVSAAVFLVYGVTLVLRFRSMRARSARAQGESS